MRTRLLVLLAAVVALSVPTPFPVHAADLHLHPIVNGSYVSECNLVEPAGAGLRQVAVVLEFSGENLLGVRFAIAQSSINWQLLFLTSPFTMIGNYQDVSISFGTCIPTPVVVATIQYYSPGNSPCGTVRTSAAALQANIYAARCDYSEINVNGAQLTVNGVYDVPIGGYDPDCFCPALPTSPSSWGKVKALYR